MKTRTWQWIVVVALVGLVAGSAWAQEKEKAAPAGAPMDTSMAAMMAAMAKYANPGPAHKLLEKMAGKWDAVVKMWMDPSAPPTESRGVSVHEMILNGRWLRQDFTSEFMEQPFIGLGFTGYDNFRQQYVGIWMDNMSTAPMMSRGTANEAGTEFTFTGMMDEPTTGERDRKFRDVMHWTGPDQFVTEMYDTTPGKGEAKVMEITYTRAK